LLSFSSILELTFYSHPNSMPTVANTPITSSLSPVFGTKSVDYSGPVRPSRNFLCTAFSPVPRNNCFYAFLDVLEEA
jgi:hypothetical protein